MKSKAPSIKTSIPIFAATNLGGHLIIGGGGGGKQFGIPNSLISLEMDSLQQLDLLDTSDLIFSHLESFRNEPIFVAICESEIAIFSVDPSGKLSRTKRKALENLAKSKVKGDEIVHGRLCEFGREGSQRLIALTTEHNRLIVLDKDLQNVFELDLKEALSETSFLRDAASLVVGFKSGKIMMFNLRTLEFNQSITRDTVDASSKTVHENLFKGDFARVMKSQFFECRVDEQATSVTVGVLNFRNRKSRLVFVAEAQGQSQLRYRELGEIQVSCLDFFEREQVLVVGTSEGEVRVYRLDPGAGRVSILKTMKCHDLPVRKVILKDLMPKASGKQVCSKTAETGNSGKKATIKAEGFLKKFNKLGIWSFGIDYVCRVSVFDLNLRPKPLWTRVELWAVAVLLFSVLYMLIGK